MKSCILEARTVSIVRDLKTEQRQGANGAFESKDILFRIAVNRDYKVTRQENGKTISEYPTDFWLAKATGNLAQIFADNCCHKKADGKLQSRHLLLSGSFENYTSTRKVNVQPQVNIGGQLYQLNLDVDVPTTNTIFIVDGITFLDSNPNTQQAVSGTTVTAVTATPVPVGTSVPANGAVPVPVSTVPTPATNSVPTPVVAPEAQVPVQTPAQTVASQPVPQAQPVITTPQSTTPVVTAPMNPPVVDNGFSTTGIEAPF